MQDVDIIWFRNLLLRIPVDAKLSVVRFSGLGFNT
jgi:hypothetical protein